MTGGRNGDKGEPTPTLRQYLMLKREVPTGVVLMLRLGDFYEAFGEDATAASAIMGTRLDCRNNVPMTGFPFHNANTYLARLVSAGKTVALADVADTPRRGRLTRREITRMITPETAKETRTEGEVA